MAEVFLLLGGNLGDVESNISKSSELIKEKIGNISKVSAIYRTEPWGYSDQPWFLNQVVVVETLLKPDQVLEQTKSIEQMIGKVKKHQWGERLIDIDILFYNNEIIEHNHLIIPHPQLHLRNFTLAPLAEIASEKIHPVFGISIRELLDNSSDPLKVEKSVDHEA